jgi:hypothetical protein
MIIYRSIQDRAIDQALARIKPVAVNELVAVNSRRGAYPGTDARRGALAGGSPPNTSAQALILRVLLGGTALYSQLLSHFSPRR